MTEFSELSLDEVLSNFELFDEWEDKYVYLMELGKKLPPLASEEKSETNRIHGCQAEVWVKTDFDENSPPRLYLSGDSNSAIVKGLVAVVILIFSGLTANEVAATNEKPVFTRLGLDQYLSPTRKVGLASMVKTIKLTAGTKAAQDSGQ